MPPKKDRVKPRGARLNQVAKQEDLVSQGMRQLGLPAEERSVSLLIAYINLLLQQNQTMNLTAITSPLEAVTKHLMDLLSIAQYVPDGRVVDVGCGGGCPGIPLAIIKPESQIILVESKNKKADFLTQQFKPSSLKTPKPFAKEQRVSSLQKKQML